MSDILPPPCPACGGEIVHRLDPGGPSLSRRCSSCGERHDLSIDPDSAAAEVLAETARDRERLRDETATARPLVLVWLPPSGDESRVYEDVAAQIRERLVEDDPTIALKTSPYPSADAGMDDATTGLADLTLLAAPDREAARSALGLIGESIPKSRGLVLHCGRGAVDGLEHSRLVSLDAREDEPGGLFDAIGRILSDIRRVALWHALDPDAPEGEPLAFSSSHEDRILAHTDDACAYLLRLVDLIGPIPADRLVERAGGEALAARLEVLTGMGAVEEDGGEARVSKSGRRVLRSVLPPPDERPAPESPLARLFLEARAGNQEALGRILKQGGEEARRIAHQRLGPALRANVETMDITQSVIADLMKGIRQFEFRSEPAWKGYLRRLVENKIRAKVDYFGAAKRDVKRVQAIDDGPAGERREIAGKSPSPEAALLREEEYGRLEASLDRLPDAEREVLILRVFEGLSHREIARRLGRPSEGAVHKFYGRALARLASLMGREA